MSFIFCRFSLFSSSVLIFCRISSLRSGDNIYISNLNLEIKLKIKTNLFKDWKVEYLNKMVKKTEFVVFDAPKSFNPFEDYLVQEIQRPKVINDLFEYKYRPTDLQGFVGNRENLDTIKNWIDDKSRKFCIISGPTGSGKSLLAELCLKDYNVIYFDLTEDMDAFFDKLTKIVSSRHIDIFEKIHDDTSPKPSAIVIEDFDKTVGDGVYYKKFVSIVEKSKIPIICIISATKKYKVLVELTYPSREDLAPFCDNVLKQERISVSPDALDLLLSKSKHDFRKILHYFKLITLRSVSSETTVDDIRRILNFSESDNFFTAYEVVDSAFNSNKIEPFNELVESCSSDFFLIVDLLYSNIGSLKIEDFSKIADNFSESDILKYFIYNTCSWELIDYYVVQSCVDSIRTVKSKLKKKIKLKKTQVISWIRNKGTFQEINDAAAHTRLRPDDCQYVVNNIIKPVITKKLEDKTLDFNDVRLLINNGLDVGNYQKISSLTYNGVETLLSSKDKNYIAKKFREFNDS